MVKQLFVLIALGVLSAPCFAQTPPPATQLNSGVPLLIAGDEDSVFYAAITVPANTPVLQFTTRGGTGDVDLTITSPDGSVSNSSRDGTIETLSFANPKAGLWQIQAMGYLAYSGVSLTASLITPALLNPNNSILSGLSAVVSSETFYRIPVPAGAVGLYITTSGGTGDLDIFLRQGAPATCQPDAADVVVSCFTDAMSESDGNVESIVIGNPAQGDWYLDLLAYDSYDGVTVNISTTVPALNVSSGGSVTAITPGTGNTLNTGYATASVSAGSSPFATAVYSFSQNGIVVSEAGIPASPPTPSSRIFIDYRTNVVSGLGTLNVRTGLAIANPNATSADLTFTLRDTSGQPLATGHGTLPARAHRARFIDELNLIAPDFNLPANFSTSILYGSLEITSTQSVSVLALRLTTNQRGDTILTSTPVADLSGAQSSSAVYFPQLANGGGFTTSVVLMNTSASTETGTIALFSDTGVPLVVQPVNGTSGSIFPYSIPASGSLVLQTDGSPSSTQVGWIRVTPSPGSNAPVGAGLFSYSPYGILITESGVPAAVPTTKARLYIDKSNGHDTGIALVNPGNTNATVTMRAFQTDGTTSAGDGPATMDVAGGGYRAAFAGQLVSGLPSGFRGVAEISATSPFAALTLRSMTNSRNDTLLTTFPVADANQPAPGPIVFPQIADGLGFTTQFIFISAGGTASVNVTFTNDDGVPLAIGLNP